MTSTLELTGLDGSNPLAFLSAVGAFRLIDQEDPSRCRMCWQARGRWIPVLESPSPVSADELVTRLHARLHRTADPGAADEARHKQKVYESLVKQSKDAAKRVQARRLRGAEREAALQAEVAPRRLQEAEARRQWLQALIQAVPTPFLALGKTLTVSSDEYRQFAASVYERLVQHAEPSRSLPARREDADFAAAFGCEACTPRQGDGARISATHFQLITGSGQQFFLETLRILMEEITPEKLRRALFGPWTYADLKRSFRWHPQEDRRYAYGWSDPSGDDVRTEHGANLLAAMALPLFPAVPVSRGLATTAFTLQRQPLAFTWPIWDAPLSVDVVRTLLALEQLQDEAPDRVFLRRLGVIEVFRSLRIEVGKAPLSKLNLTPSEAV